VLPAETHAGPFEKRRPGGADDVSHLHGRPVHGELRRSGGRERVERTRRRLQMPV
jgi:hypothetical protein